MSTYDARGQAGPQGATVVALREHRQLLLAEQRRCRHVGRLLRARLDLTIASTMELPATGCALSEAGLRSGAITATFEAMVLFDGGSGPPSVPDVATRLRDLRTALRCLAAYTEQLTTEIDDVTGLYVAALAADPASCLAQAMSDTAPTAFARAAPTT